MLNLIIESHNKRVEKTNGTVPEFKSHKTVSDDELFSALGSKLRRRG
jgi:hypothetical protein